MRRADANGNGNGNGNGWMAKATGGNAGSALENPNQIIFFFFAKRLHWRSSIVAASLLPLNKLQVLALWPASATESQLKLSIYIYMRTNG